MLLNQEYGYFYNQLQQPLDQSGPSHHNVDLSSQYSYGYGYGYGGGGGGRFGYRSKMMARRRARPRTTTASYTTPYHIWLFHIYDDLKDFAGKLDYQHPDLIPSILIKQIKSNQRNL
ncbi:hypothetical protein M0811_05425 [Anaeramoeba ignava]|uniref:Uncharacterized protein n=1 Tax=Anaeramoeba ignava TaxID=1746090 RepID=A0A9Q0LSE9_ANAIG|nr:hypothetical protein M0811_05425 [Anaeramoeba ignava]